MSSFLILWAEDSPDFSELASEATIGSLNASSQQLWGRPGRWTARMEAKRGNVFLCYGSELNPTKDRGDQLLGKEPTLRLLLIRLEGRLAPTRESKVLCRMLRGRLSHRID